MKSKWKYKVLSNKISRENKEGMVLRMILEHFGPCKGKHFKLQKENMKYGINKCPSICKVYEEGRMLRMILEHIGPWKGNKFMLKEASHTNDGRHKGPLMGKVYNHL